MEIRIDPKYVKELFKSTGVVKQLDPLLIASSRTGKCFPVEADPVPTELKIGDSLVFTAEGAYLKHLPASKSKGKSSSSSSGMVDSQVPTKNVWF